MSGAVDHSSRALSAATPTLLLLLPLIKLPSIQSTRRRLIVIRYIHEIYSPSNFNEPISAHDKSGGQNFRGADPPSPKPESLGVNPVQDECMCIVSTLPLTRFDPACNLSLFLFDFFWHSLDLITRRKQSYLWQNFILTIMSQYGSVSYLQPRLLDRNCESCRAFQVPSEQAPYSDVDTIDMEDDRTLSTSEKMLLPHTINPPTTPQHNTAASNQATTRHC